MALDDIGRAIWGALQDVGQGVRDWNAYEKLGPDFREIQDFDRRKRDLTLRGLEYQAGKQEELDALNMASKRQDLLKDAAGIGALQLEGEADRIDAVPQETMDVGGFDVNLPSAAATPNAPEIPAEVRSQFPDMSDDAMASMIRGRHAEGKRPMKLLEQQVREALLQQQQSGRSGLETQRHGFRLEEIGARGDESRKTKATVPGKAPSGAAGAGERRFNQGLDALHRETERSSSSLDRERARLLREVETGKITREQYDSMLAQAEATHRRREAINSTQREVAVRSTRRPGQEPTASAPAGGGVPQMVKYRGQLVPFDQLPPELQALVRAKAGGR